MVIRAEMRGLDVSQVLMGSVAVSFFAAILGGTFFLVRAAPYGSIARAKSGFNRWQRTSGRSSG
jgi:hypothetical protein